MTFGKTFVKCKKNLSNYLSTGSWYSKFAEKIFNEDPKLTADKSRTPLLDTIFGGCGQFVLSSPFSSSLVNVDESEEFSVVDILVLVRNLPLLWSVKARLVPSCGAADT